LCYLLRYTVRQINRHAENKNILNPARMNMNLPYSDNI
jgi:hypothetical protein